MILDNKHISIALIKLLAFLFITGILGDYAYNYRIDREMRFHFEEKLYLMER